MPWPWKCTQRVLNVEMVVWGRSTLEKAAQKEQLH